MVQSLAAMNTRLRTESITHPLLLYCHQHALPLRTQKGGHGSAQQSGATLALRGGYLYRRDCRHTESVIDHEWHTRRVSAGEAKITVINPLHEAALKAEVNTQNCTSRWLLVTQ